MTLQVALGGVRVGRSSLTERTFYCPRHGRVQRGDEAARPVLLDCPSCLSFLDPKPKLGTGERMRAVSEKWGLKRPATPAADD